MVAALAHRGPDAAGRTESDYYALGVRRLSIFATDFGSQPVADADRRVTLAFNGEIYNYIELASDLLKASGVTVKSEAEALLRLYLSNNVEFIERVDGDYAIVVCDDRSRECHLFRDPFGVKPLYYAPIAGGRAWAAASEVQAFFHHPEFSTDWDEVALWERRVLGFSAVDRTNFAAIKQVPPGSRVTLAGATQPRVAEFEADPGDARAGGLANDDIAEQCATVLRRAVGRRIAHCEHFPIALALSGGIDSTIIACLSGGGSPGNVVAVTMGGSGDEADASTSLRVAESLSLPFAFEQVTGQFLYSNYAQIVLAGGGHGAAYSTYVLGEAIRRFCPGAKVALCGEGADELFLGYWMHVRSKRYVERSMDALKSVPVDSIESSSLLQIVAAWGTLGGERIQAQLNRMLRTHQLVNRHLIAFDHGMMAHGIECRVPFLDREVARFIAAVPEAARTSGQTTKLLLRMVASDLLRPLGTALERLVLDRKPSSLREAMSVARAGLSRRVGAAMAGLDFQRSRLARFAVGTEDLFWLGAVDSVFLRHRARVEGLEPAGMEAEIADAILG